MTKKEFHSLEPGDVICRKDAVWLVVTANNSTHAVTNSLGGSMTCMVLYTSAKAENDGWVVGNVHVVFRTFCDKYERVDLSP